MIIDPRVYFKEDNCHVWQNNPLWLASISDFNNNSYLVPEHDQGTLLVSRGNSIHGIDNICTHKNAIILKGRGNIGSVITCPIHKWTWDLDGKIKGARGFQKTCEKNLRSRDIFKWNGHLFRNSTFWPNDIDERLRDISKYIDITNHSWHSSSTVRYHFDWKIFMEIFLDLYHVQSYHPGLSSLTDCKTFDWVFGDNWSCQTAMFNRRHAKDPSYQDLDDLYKTTGHYDTAVYGSVWLGIYPNIMIEYYPGCIVISTVWPDGPGRCINHLEFYYEKGLLEKIPEFATIQQKCFMITADEDEEIGLRMQTGLSLRKDPFLAQNHPIEEAGYAHFYNWINKVSLQDES